MISPDKLERYSEFVDPEHTGVSYDPRQGLERLLGVLSPDPKGIVLAAMGQDWYGTKSQLHSAIFSWLEEVGLQSSIWPISINSSWPYVESRDTDGEITDGSLVDLGAVVKKAEDSSQTFYSRSVAGVELAVPLVQYAVRFVSKAREYGEAQKIRRKTTHKFDSMSRIVGSVASSTDLRRPTAVWDVINFLVHNLGKHTRLDIENQTNISAIRLNHILTSLDNCGIIDYISAKIEVDGYTNRGWTTSRLTNPELMTGLDPDKVYREIKSYKSNFHHHKIFNKIIDYVKKHPDFEYDYRKLSNELTIPSSSTSIILAFLVEKGILQRLNTDYTGKERITSASANDLTHLFYDLVCIPAKEMADTLSPSPLSAWDKEEVARYLENYDEERSQRGSWAGKYVRRLLVDILAKNGQAMKISHIIDLYNNQTDRELSEYAIRHHFKRWLLKSGEVEQPKPGYYKLAQKTN